MTKKAKILHMWIKLYPVSNPDYTLCCHFMSHDNIYIAFTHSPPTTRKHDNSLLYISWGKGPLIP